MLNKENNRSEKNIEEGIQSKERKKFINFDDWRCAILVNYPKRQMTFVLYHNTNT